MKKHIRKILAVISCCLMIAAIPCMACADNFVDTQQQVTVTYVVTPDMLPVYPTVTPVIAAPVIVTPMPTYRPIIQTGDNNNRLLISLAAAISLLTAIAIFVYIRKSKEEK